MAFVLLIRQLLQSGRMVREGLTALVEAGPEGEREKEFQAEGRAGAKALRREHAEHFQRTARRLVGLEQREQEGLGGEVSKVTRAGGGADNAGQGVSKRS